MITIAEELVLLAVEDDGKIAYTAGSPEFAMALVGACLIELNLAGRIDADVDSVKVLSPAPTGIGVLDFVLDKISAGNSKSSRAWVRDLHSHYTELFRLTLRLLLERGILQQTESRFMWALRSRRYPVIDDREQKEAKLRICALLLSDDIPTPHDTVLISLAVEGGLLESFLSRNQIAQLAERIDQIGGLDLIARAVEDAIRDEAELRVSAVMMAVH